MEKHFSIDKAGSRLRQRKGRGSGAAGLAFLAALVLAPLTNSRIAGARVADGAARLPGATLPLNVARKSASDLEVGGDLAGLPHGSTRYVAVNSLLALPQ